MLHLGRRWRHTWYPPPSTRGCAFRQAQSRHLYLAPLHPPQIAMVRGVNIVPVRAPAPATDALAKYTTSLLFPVMYLDTNCSTVRSCCVQLLSVYFHPAPPGRSFARPAAPGGHITSKRSWTWRDSRHAVLQQGGGQGELTFC